MDLPAPPSPDTAPPATDAPRPAAESSAATPGAETALLWAIGQAGGPARVDPAESYVTAGGRLLRAPGVLAALRAAGWGGISVRDLGGPLPLRVLAGRLVPVLTSTGQEIAATGAGAEFRASATNLAGAGFPLP
jgi:hypothetical protein